MKIYCIIFDALDHSGELEKLFKKKDMHYARLITNSYTSSTLSSMLTGLTSVDNHMQKYGWDYNYKDYPENHKKEKMAQLIYNQLPDDWKVYTIFDEHNWEYMDTQIGKIDRNKWISLTAQGKEQILERLNDVQKISSKENSFIYFHLHEMHGYYANNNQSEKEKLEIIEHFFEYINNINFEEEDTLFWLSSDHGNYLNVNEYMNPPESFLQWVSVTDNITNKKVKKDLIHMQDFYNTAYNRIYNTSIKNNNQDVLSNINLNRVYLCDDGRNNVPSIEFKAHTTISAIKRISKTDIIQVVYHYPKKEFKHCLFNIIANEINSGKLDDTYIGIVEELKVYLQINCKEYFND